MKETENTAVFDRTQATLALEAPITTVRLVSPARAKTLGKLGISTVRDLVTSYPRRYIDMSHVSTVAGASIGEACTIRARVHEVKVKRPKRTVLAEVTLVDGTGTLIVTAFRQPWLADQLPAGANVAVSGRVEFNYGFKRMTNPHIEVLEGAGEGFHGMILPVHPLTAGVKAGMMRRFVENALIEVRGAVDPLPLALRNKYRLMSRTQALSCIHFPHTMDEQREARRRLAYEEVLLLQLMVMQGGQRRSEGRTPVTHVVDGPCMNALGSAIPFELTDEQVRARDEILDRLSKPAAANHLLLGDVGTGKTIVAAFALAAAADTGGQALFMAPTEILAQQHASSLGPLLDKAGISWDLLTGSTSAADRACIVENLADGATSVLFGTHALLEDDIAPSRCTLVVIDEQQRFGVDQRGALMAKGECVDALYLTATPIPRSLALALFGNLTLSYLKARPRSAPPRKTYLHTIVDKGVAYDAALAACKRGEQAYIVCPLVGEKTPSGRDAAGGKGASSGERHTAVDEDVYEYADISIEDDGDMSGGNIAAAEAEASFLQAKVFVDYRVGLLHGKMAPDEKRRVMDAFRSGEVQVLVSTTVIEVGVDVPRATVMIIEDADRFGLSQLHQLRGRVGRGGLPGEVHLISGTKKENALSRLSAMVSTDDGFELASYDLSLRREGDILGNRQHGASQLKLVNVVRDSRLIEAAHADAAAILEEDPALESDLYKPLAREARVVYRRE